MILVMLTQGVQMFAYEAGIVGSLAVGHAVGASDTLSTWIAASHPLVQGSFVVLISSRLGTVYGHKRMMTLGSAIRAFWMLATAYGRNIIVGVAGGCTLDGILFEWVDWTWLFFFLAVLGSVVYGAAIMVVPDDEPLDPGGTIDWVGAYLGMAGLIPFNFIWNQAPIAGWSNPYEYVLLIVPIVHFSLFLLWEANWAMSPIIPFDIWKVSSFGALILVLFFVFMRLGIYVWYVSVWLHNLRGWGPVMMGYSFLPMEITGTGAAFFAAWVVRKMPAEVVVCLGSLGAVGMNILVFPAMIFAGIIGDMVFAAGQIIASNIVGKKHQGTAASLIGTLFTYGLSTGLGFAGTVEDFVNNHEKDLVEGYRGATYLGTGFRAIDCVITLFFVRMKKNDVEGWQGEDAEKYQPEN
ncbi:major facilitator superfamily domain-containing protein [Trichoderma austrokoningii]